MLGQDVAMSEDWVVDQLDLGSVTRLPDFHPDAEALPGGYRVYGWLVRGSAGTFLVDTGVGVGSAVIDEWYGPEVVDVAEALAVHGVGVEEVDRVVISHLHFDHCGQLAAFDVPVVVQAAELAMLDDPYYTVAEWADRPADRWQVIDGDHELAAGVSVLSTPGHTPGHQSVVVDTSEGTVVIGGQCAFMFDDLTRAEPGRTNVPDERLRPMAVASLERIAALEPVRVFLSHDTE
jgi:N-acyl homoserine lactone hydrolase